ncbi:MAG TPA: RDD family protein [Armatimonadota bacterium]|nr:RDD family protein [Armatimonadota bacterium]
MTIAFAATPLSEGNEDPAPDSSGLSDIGFMALMEGRVEDAIAVLEQAIAQEPGNFQCYNWLGIALGRKGLYESALRCFSCAVVLWPHSACYWYNLGTAHEACGQAIRAARCYHVAASITPPYEGAERALAILLAANPALQSVVEAIPAASASRCEVVEELCIRDVAVGELAASWPDSASEPGWEMLQLAGGGLASGMLREIAAKLPGSLHGRAAGFPGFLTRATSAMIDVIVIELIGILAIILVNLIQYALPGQWTIPNIVPIALLGIGGLAYIVVPTARWGQTIGKKVMSIRVVDRSGHTPNLRRSLLRALAVGLDAALAGVGYAWVAVDRRHRSLHDRLASTYVTGRTIDPGTALISIAALAGAALYLEVFLRAQWFG